MITDAELVARCRNGDAEAWNELVERFSRYVYAIAMQAFRLGPHDAEDVFQEVFARVYQHLDRLRSARREGPADDELLDPAGLDESLGQLDEAMTVRASLDAVGEACREILDRFFCRDESYRSIGEELGLPAGTIASRISRCLAKLRAELEGRSEVLAPSGDR